MQVQENLTKVTSALRGLEPLSCDDIEILLAVLAAKMKVSGFGNVDIAAIDDAIGCICGHDLAEVAL